MLPFLMWLLENFKYIWDILFVYNVMLQNTSHNNAWFTKTHTHTPGWSTGLKSHSHTHTHTHTRSTGLKSHTHTHPLHWNLTHTHTPGWSTTMKPHTHTHTHTHTRWSTGLKSHTHTKIKHWIEIWWATVHGVAKNQTWLSD